MVCAGAITISILSNDPSQRDFFSFFDFRYFGKSSFEMVFNLWINIIKHPFKKQKNYFQFLKFKTFISLLLRSFFLRLETFFSNVFFPNL